MTMDERAMTATRRCRVGCSSSAPARARAFVADAGQDWGLPEIMIESAQLATSELVSNSVEHALSGVEIVLERHANNRLRISVRDNSPTFPVMHPVEAARPRGRGMALVEALAEVWGVTPHPDGKTIWLELAPTTDDSVLEGSQMPEVAKRASD
jgi:anti-sigma regulatory factor (Ser/Thr protein kinase)